MFRNPVPAGPVDRVRGRALKFLLVALLLVTALPVASASAAFTVYSPSDPDYPQKVDWVTNCYVAKTANDDAIVFPGQPGRSHNHTFSGNLGINASSTAEELINQPSNCEMSRDRASYWMPTVSNDGKPVMPYVTRAYYRAGTTDGKSIQPIPFGLHMLAGDAMATAPQSAGVAGWHCRRDPGGALSS